MLLYYGQNPLFRKFSLFFTYIYGSHLIIYNGIFFSYATINPSIKNFVRSIQKNEINKHATTNEWLSVKYCKFSL